MTPRVLVTGASGMIGRAVCMRMRRDGRGVITAGRGRDDVAWSAGEPLSNALDGVGAVVHLAACVHVRGKGYSDRETFEAVNTQATLQLAREAAACGVRRFVFMSSIGVLGSVSGEPLVEDARPRPHTAYTHSKYLAECRLREFADIETVILRPPAVIGPGARGNLQSMISAVRRRLPLPFAAIRNTRHFVALENLVDAIMLALDHDKAANETFHVANAEAWSTPALCREIGSAIGAAPRLWPCPPSLLQGALSLIGRRSLADGLTRDLLVDTRKAQAVLGWRPRQSLRDALQSAVEVKP